MSNQFPYLQVSGSHGDIGRAIGKEFAKRIISVVEKRRASLANYYTKLELVKPYYQQTCEVFPQLIEEMTEVAKVARVPALEYFFLSCPEVFTTAEIKAWYGDDRLVERCTTVVGFDAQKVVVGHNEDNPPETDPDLYVLKATIGSTTFLGLHYATEIGGGAAAMNSWGLVQCINTLHTEHAMGVPRAFLARAVLECQTLDEAELLVRRVSRASGYNHVLVQGREVRNLESSPAAVGVVRTDKAFVHTNHFVIPEMASQEAFHTQSSEERYTSSMSQLQPKMDEDDVSGILRSVRNNTRATLLFSSDKKLMKIARISDSNNEYTTYHL